MSESDFFKIVRKRRAVRDFLDKELSQEQIREVLNDARWAPSNANIQPWQVHIVSGESKNRLAEAMREDLTAGKQSLDYWWDYENLTGIYRERQHAMSHALYTAVGIPREDKEARWEYLKNKFPFYGAPHAAFLFMPEMGDNVRLAGDLGMYGQTFLLSLTARGYAGLAQTSYGMFADTVRRELHIPENMKMLFGISFGYAASDDLSERTNPGRAELSENIINHE